MFGAAISPAAASRPSRQACKRDAGPPPVKTEAALRVCAPLLEEPVANRANWTIPRLIARDQKARTRRYRAIATLQGAAKKNFRWRRPRHTLKGRQIAAEDRARWAPASVAQGPGRGGDIVLLYGDESEALTHPYLSRAAQANVYRERQALTFG